MFDQNFALITPVHPHLTDVEIRCFVRSEQDVVMGRVLVLPEHVRNNVTAEMVIAACG